MLVFVLCCDSGPELLFSYFAHRYPIRKEGVAETQEEAVTEDSQGEWLAFYTRRESVTTVLITPGRRRSREAFTTVLSLSFASLFDIKLHDKSNEANTSSTTAIAGSPCMTGSSPFKKMKQVPSPFELGKMGFHISFSFYSYR
ncbi:hypothetical protein C0Q70_15682 [Pomacea canaliculata]|uniref:Uncharacterized protein n=1 Tax=Pomacea canaliculata TaxID=400727 RepID=A0A2T7NVK4_POMCA|nr:hypothetical protein C0Q70_15682 [Pomacea canaliculata]